MAAAAGSQEPFAPRPSVRDSVVCKLFCSDQGNTDLSRQANTRGVRFLDIVPVDD